MECYDVKMSLGVVWKPFINDIEHVIYEADALMYEEKEHIMLRIRNRYVNKEL